MSNDPIKSALLKDVQKTLEKLVDDIHEVGNTFLTDEGDICEDSQLMCIKNAANCLGHIVNGLTESDLK